MKLIDLPDYCSTIKGFECPYFDPYIKDSNCILKRVNENTEKKWIMKHIDIIDIRKEIQNGFLTVKIEKGNIYICNVDGERVKIGAADVD